MKRWYKAVDDQRRIWQQMQRDSAVARAAGVSSTEFQWTRDQGSELRNPYAEQDDDEDDNEANFQSSYNSDFAQSDYSVGRNGSNTSLQMRSRTNTGESGPSGGRVAPPRFPMGAQAPALSVRTQIPGGQQGSAVSPSEYMMDSYFSPTTDSPVSTRSSGQLSSHVGMFPFPRQQVPNMANGWSGDDNARFTAPAMPRQPSRDGALSGYQARGRPSLPPSAVSSQSRLRSASSPDINNPLPRQVANPTQPGVPELPPFPAHYAYQPNVLGRANNGSPQQNMPLRASTQSPNVQQQRDRMPPPRSIPLPVQDYQGGPMYGQPPLTRAMTNVDRAMTPEMRSMTPGSIDARMMTPVSIDPRNHSPPMPSLAVSEIPIPTQLKVKVHCPTAGHSFMLVVPTSISYTSLKDRIDAKLQRTTNLSLNTGQVKLKYLDEDDYVSIQSDEDVQMAFETWREQQRDHVQAGQLGEIELYVQ
jgi:cell division control protein 24